MVTSLFFRKSILNSFVKQVLSPIRVPLWLGFTDSLAEDYKYSSAGIYTGEVGVLKVEVI